MAGLDELEAELQRLPTWSYGLIAGVTALGGLWWYRKHEAASVATASTSTASTATDAGGQTTDSLMNLDDEALSAESGSTGSGSTVGSTSTNVTSNALWESQSVAYLGTTGVAPLTAETALENYLNGVTLTSAQAPLVNSAITQFGLPPEGAQGTPTVTAPSTVTPAQKTIDTTNLTNYQTELTNYQAELRKEQALPASAGRNNAIAQIQRAIAVVQKQISMQSATVNSDAS